MIYTIGYGNRSFEDFIALLTANNTQFLIGVRSQPFSRHKPDFSYRTSKIKLLQHEIQYVCILMKMVNSKNNVR